MIWVWHVFNRSQLVFLDWWPALDPQQFPRREIQQIHRLLRATSMQSSTSTASETAFGQQKLQRCLAQEVMKTQRNHQNTIDICHHDIAEIVDSLISILWSAVNSSPPRLIKAWSGDRYLQRKPEQDIVAVRLLTDSEKFTHFFGFDVVSCYDIVMI